MVEISSLDSSFQINDKNLIRIKHLFLLFLKQLDSEEFKLACKYLKHVMNKKFNDPYELFGKN